MPAAKKKSSGRILGAKATETRDRILSRSVQFFNRYGVLGSSTEQIAADLQISQGNLNYYFPRKRDLIEACLDQLHDGLRAALTHPEAFRSAEELTDFLVTIYRTLWDYRFFFLGFTDVVTDDAALRKRFVEFNDWAVRAIEADMLQFIELGNMVEAEEPNTVRLLAENAWSIWMNWLRMAHVANPRARTPKASALYACALRQWSVSQPWLTRAYSRELLAAIRARLVDDEDGSAAD